MMQVGLHWHTIHTNFVKISQVVQKLKGWTPIHPHTDREYAGLVNIDAGRGGKTRHLPPWIIKIECNINYKN
jgi:hypothetical protein